MGPCIFGVCIYTEDKEKFQGQSPVEKQKNKDFGFVRVEFE